MRYPSSFFYIVAAFLCVLSLHVTAQKADDELFKTEIRLFEALTQNDWVVFEEVLAEDLVYTHSNAKTDTKAQYIADLKAGKVKYNTIKPEDVQVRLYNNGSMGIITGRAVVEVTQNGQSTTSNLRYTDVYVKRKGKWQQVSWQSTRIPE